MKDRDKPRDELLAELVKFRQKVKELEESRTLLKDNERYIQAANALLRLYAGAVSRREYLGAAVKLASIWSDCRYAGIRILNHKGEIPYESYLGFSREFWEAENWLSIHKDQCACVRVFTRKPESQDISVMTRGGSFYLDNSVKFLQSLPEEQRARFRGVCIKCGFKSIAIIPIGVKGKIIGVIHIADKKGGKEKDENPTPRKGRSPDVVDKVSAKKPSEGECNGKGKPGRDFLDCETPHFSRIFRVEEHNAYNRNSDVAR